MIIRKKRVIDLTKLAEPLIFKTRNWVMWLMPVHDVKETNDLQKRKYELGDLYCEQIKCLVERVASIKKPFMDAVQMLIDGFTQIEQNVYIEDRPVREDEIATMEECLDVMNVLIQSLKEEC